MQSVMMGAACASVDDRGKTISVNKKYMVLGQEKMQRQLQTLALHDGVAFDLLTGKNEAWQERRFYFDIPPLHVKLSNTQR